MDEKEFIMVVRCELKSKPRGAEQLPTSQPLKILLALFRLINPDVTHVTESKSVPILLYDISLAVKVTILYKMMLEITFCYQLLAVVVGCLF